MVGVQGTLHRGLHHTSAINEAEIHPQPFLGKIEETRLFDDGIFCDKYEAKIEGRRCEFHAIKDKGAYFLRALRNLPHDCQIGHDLSFASWSPL